VSEGALLAKALADAGAPAPPQRGSGSQNGSAAAAARSPGALAVWGMASDADVDGLLTASEHHFAAFVREDLERQRCAQVACCKATFGTLPRAHLSHCHAHLHAALCMS
jgi:hypothetical protein